MTVSKPATLVVTNVQLKLVDSAASPKLRAHARVILNDQLQLTSLRVYDGTRGLFVSYPNDPGVEDFRQIFYPVTRELRDHIEETILIEYRTALAATPRSIGDPLAPDPEVTK